jgi:hypothetical protein
MVVASYVVAVVVLAKLEGVAERDGNMRGHKDREPSSVAHR